MTENTVSEVGSLAEPGSRNAGAAEARIMRAGDLDLQQVTFAGLAICNSNHDIHCGLSVVLADRAPETVAATDVMPVLVDWLQHELRQGPSFGPDPGELLVVKDLAADERWPDFGRMCAALNLRSMVSIRIAVDSPDRARLYFYSSEHDAFDHLDVDAALKLVRLAAPIVTMLIDEFRGPLLCAAESDCSRVAIAVGTLMAHYRVNSADAFNLLSGASHDLRRALFGVAIDVVPDGHPPQAVTPRAWGQRTAEGRLSQAQGRTTATPPGVRPQPSGPQAPTRRAGAARTGAHRAPSIGGPKMWHDPLPAMRLATPAPGAGALPVTERNSTAVRVAARGRVR